MKGLILSGGTGTRLYPLTYTSAKQLIPVANKPVLFRVIESIRDAGISEIGIVVGDTAAEIRGAVGQGEQFGVEITYIEQRVDIVAHCVFGRDASCRGVWLVQITALSEICHDVADGRGRETSTVMFGNRARSNRLGGRYIVGDQYLQYVAVAC